MRSMIDEIAQAEEKANQLKQDAGASARELMQQARQKAEEMQTRIGDEEREKTRQALEKAEADGKVLAAAIEKLIGDEASQQCEKAWQKMDDAIQLLLDKVQEI